MTALSDRVRKLLEIDPAAGAVEFEGRWYSWGQLGAVAKGLASQLDAMGSGPNTPVGLVLRNSPEMIGAMLGTIANECCIVTLNPHQGNIKLSQDVRDARVPILVAHAQDWDRPGFLEAVREVGALGLKIDYGMEPPLRPVPGLERISGGPHRPPASGVAVEMLTSGTTGPPKRVLLNYASFERTISAAGEHHRPKDALSGDGSPRLSRGVAIVNFPFVHMSGLFRTLLNVSEGRKIALLERFRVEPWLELVRRHRPKAVGLVPTALRMVLEGNVERTDLGEHQGSDFRIGQA